MKTILKNSTGQVWTGNQVQSYMSFGVLYFKSEKFKHAFEVHFEERKDLDLLIAQLQSYRDSRDRTGQDVQRVEVGRLPPKFVEAYNSLVDRVAALEKCRLNERLDHLSRSTFELQEGMTKRLGELERKADVIVDVQALQEMLTRWTAAQRLLSQPKTKTKPRGKKAKS